MEYRIAVSGIRTQSGDVESVVGAFVYIVPPVRLSCEAVHRLLTTGNLRPGAPAEENAVSDAVLLGNTAEQTTIYAAIATTEEGRASVLLQDLAYRTVQLLDFMGARAMIGAIE